MRTKQRPGVRTRRWTKAEYYQLYELGFFHAQRVELIGGKLVVHSPQNSPHATGIVLGTVALSACFGPTYHLRVQLPIDLGPNSEPEPDFAVVAGNLRQYQNAHPTGADLIVEVSDTTLRYDRGRKGSLYARAGILDYWVVNLVDSQVEVYRDPVPDPTQPYGFRYASRVDLKPPAQVGALALPGQAIAVADLLP